MKKLLLVILCLGPLTPAAAYTVVSAANKYMVENTSGTDPSGNVCYDFQTTPQCRNTVNNLVISTSTLGPGSTNYIQNTNNPSTATQVFHVSSGTFTDAIIQQNSPGLITQVLTSSGTANPPQWSWNGIIPQVVQAQIIISSAVTSTTFVPTTLTVTITPKSPNDKILVMVSAEALGAGTADFIYTIQRKIGGGAFTDLGNSTQGFANNNCGIATAACQLHIAPIVLDSPNTTSAVIYTVYGRAQSGSTTLGINASTQDIIAVEIGTGN